MQSQIKTISRRALGFTLPQGKGFSPDAAQGRTLLKTLGTVLAWNTFLKGSSEAAQSLPNPPLPGAVRIPMVTSSGSRQMNRSRGRWMKSFRLSLQHQNGPGQANHNPCTAHLTAAAAPAPQPLIALISSFTLRRSSALGIFNPRRRARVFWGHEAFLDPAGDAMTHLDTGQDPDWAGRGLGFPTRELKPPPTPLHLSSEV